MASLEDTRNLQFRVETLIVHNGAKRGRLRQDADGYYLNVPVAALGIPSRNRTYYDIRSFGEQINNPSSGFNQRLTTGQLYGEWGHPDLSIYDSEDKMINRLADVNQDKWSHHFRGLHTGEQLEGGGVVLEADLCPTGPYKSDLEDNLSNPIMNTAFSLRAITSQEFRDGLSWRTMRKLITFDSVGAGGYLEASKMFSSTLATENFDTVDISFDPSRGRAIFTQASLESFTSSELNDLFETSHVSVMKNVVTVADVGTERFGRFPALRARSLFFERFKE